MAYATIAQLKRELRIDSGDTSQDLYLTDLLDWVTGLIDQYTKRKFSASPITVTDEVHDFTDGNKVWLANTNIKSVTAVKVGQTSPITLDSTAYQWNALGRLIVFVSDYSWPTLENPTNSDFYLDYVKVSYTYAGDGVPKDIEGACVQAAAKIHRSNGVSKEEIGDYKITYTDARSVFDDFGVLDAYRLRGV